MISVTPKLFTPPLSDDFWLRLREETLLLDLDFVAIKNSMDALRRRERPYINELVKLDS